MIARHGRIAGSAVLLVLAILFGGGQSAAFSMILELAALALLALCLGVSDGRPLPNRTGLGIVFIGLMLLLPLAQLVPLPPSIWTALPGRGFAAQVEATAGLPALWRPLSLDPGATLRCALELLPGIAIFLAILGCDAPERRWLTLIVVGLAGASAVLGLMQLGGAPYLYTDVDRSQPDGFFANHNHEAALLILAIPLAAAAMGDTSGRNSVFRLILGGAATILAIAVVTTRSRTGLALLPLALAGAAFIALGTLTKRTMLAIGAAGLAIAAIVVLLLPHLTIVHGALARFGTAADDLRFSFWRNTIYAIGLYWPFGSGLGTFVPVYASIESFDTLHALYINHAHNDYLELVLETGIAGPALVLLYLLLVAYMIVQPSPASVHRQRAAAALGILLLLLHSVTDYPLREIAHSTVLGLLTALLFPPPSLSRAVNTEPRLSRNEAG